MTRAQIITALWLVVVICLGTTALLLPEPGKSTPAPTPLIGFPPSQVASVEVTLPGGRTQRLTREGPDTWAIDLPARGLPDDAVRIRWPASAERVRAFLRILDRLRGTPAEDAQADPATTLVITSAPGEQATIGLPASSLGGRSIVRVTPGAPDDPAPASFLTTDELSRLVTAQGMLQWVDARGFAGLSGQVNEITVTSVGGSMTITRAGAGWRIGSPFAAPAEASLVKELVDGLQTLPLADISAAVVASPADATTITLTATLRRAAPDGSITSETATHTLTTLGPVTEGGRVAVAARSTAGFGPITASLDASRLTELVRKPDYYIARRATTAQPADIRSLTLALPDGSAVSLARTDEGWARDGAPLPQADADAVESLIDLLTLTNAVVAEHAPEAPAEAQRLATVAAQGLGGLTIATAELSVATLPNPGEDTRAYALLRSDEISRYFAPEAAVDAVRWVVSLGGTP